MLDKYFVSRKAYDHDVNTLRAKLAELNKDIRKVEDEKQIAKKQTALVKSEVGGLEYEIKRLRKRLDKMPAERDLHNYYPPIPEGETQRREYMAQVAGFFEGGLKDKLNYMHSQFRNQTGMFPLTERETDFFRACINVVGLLLDWGEECVNEHRSNIANVNKKDEASAFDSQDEAIENIKRTVTSE
jgi:outer membrane murein-binding lipoprotein Lpp